MSAPLLEVRDLTIDIDTRYGQARVVDGMTFSVSKGETLGIVGESGCGKSLTMMSLVGLLPRKIAVSGGTATFEGDDLFALQGEDLRKLRGAAHRLHLSGPHDIFNPVMRIGDQIIEPLIHHRGMDKATARNRAGELLRLVGIPGGETRLDDYPHELSGGMRQRVMIAMGLACEPPLLIADEPTTALDVTIQSQIVELVKDIRDKLGHVGDLDHA